MPLGDDENTSEQVKTNQRQGEDAQVNEEPIQKEDEKVLLFFSGTATEKDQTLKGPLKLEDLERDGVKVVVIDGVGTRANREAIAGEPIMTKEERTQQNQSDAKLDKKKREERHALRRDSSTSLSDSLKGSVKNVIEKGNNAKAKIVRESSRKRLDKKHDSTRVSDLDVYADMLNGYKEENQLAQQTQFIEAIKNIADDAEITLVAHSRGNFGILATLAHILSTLKVGEQVDAGILKKISKINVIFVDPVQGPRVNDNLGLNHIATTVDFDNDQIFRVMQAIEDKLGRAPGSLFNVTLFNARHDSRKTFPLDNNDFGIYKDKHQDEYDLITSGVSHSAPIYGDEKEIGAYPKGFHPYNVLSDLIKLKTGTGGVTREDFLKTAKGNNDFEQESMAYIAEKGVPDKAIRNTPSSPRNPVLGLHDETTFKRGYGDLPSAVTPFKDLGEVLSERKKALEKAKAHFEEIEQLEKQAAEKYGAGSKSLDVVRLENKANKLKESTPQLLEKAGLDKNSTPLDVYKAQKKLQENIKSGNRDVTIQSPRIRQGGIK